MLSIESAKKMSEQIRSTLAIAVLHAIAWLPRCVAKKMALLIVFLAWKMKAKNWRRTVENIQRCFPVLSNEEQEELSKASLLHTLLAVMEMPRVWLRSQAITLGLVRHVKNAELLRAAYDRGKGVIIIAPHLGNWEVLGAYLAKDYSITNLYKPSKSEAIDKLVIEGRTANGSKLAPTNRKGVMQLIKSLKAGELIGILPDQVPEAGNGMIEAPFFGHQAQTMTLLSTLLQKTGAAAVFAYAKRLNNGQFDIVCVEPAEGLYSEELSVSVATLNDGIEAVVRQAPEQYQWAYKRFKKKKSL